MLDRCYFFFLIFVRPLHHVATGYILIIHCNRSIFAQEMTGGQLTVISSLETFPSGPGG